MNTGLQLNLDIQIQLNPQLQPILIHHATAIPPAIPLRPRRQLLLRITRPLRNLPPLRLCVRDGPVHGSFVGPDHLEGLHRLARVFRLLVLFDRGHGLLLLAAFLLFAAAGAAGLRARAVARIGFGVGAGELLRGALFGAVALGGLGFFGFGGGRLVSVGHDDSGGLGVSNGRAMLVSRG